MQNNQCHLEICNGPGLDAIMKRLRDNKFINVTLRVGDGMNGLTTKGFVAKVKSLGYINGVSWDAHFEIFPSDKNIQKGQHVNWIGKYNPHLRIGFCN